MFDKIHAKRLTTLADHLEKGDLGHEVFNFNVYNEGGQLANRCGTMGCALGECPVIFPNDWMFGSSGIPILTNSPPHTCGPQTAANVFFGIDTHESSHLFYPDEQCVDDFGGKMLSTEATRFEVAANIRAFLEYKAREQS